MTQETATHDPVSSPSHYKGRTLEAIDVIEAWGLGYHLGNAMRYILRAGKKGCAVEDLRKAQWYVSRAAMVDWGRSRSSLTPTEVAKDFDLPLRLLSAITLIQLAVTTGERTALQTCCKLLQHHIDKLSFKDLPMLEVVE